ncbi:hypothetical protein Esti_000662 [Eimeria stiedai]
MASAVVERESTGALRREATGEAVQENPQKADEQGKDTKKEGKPIIDKKLRFEDSVELKEGNEKKKVKGKAEQNEEREAEDTSSASSGEKTQTQKPVDPAAASARRLQLSLRRLVSWQLPGGRSGGARGGPLHRADRGGSPPTFVQKLTVKWPGCKGAQSITAADLGSAVALWIVYSPQSSASLALYHPHKRTIEEDLPLEAEPDAVVGVTFTAGELRERFEGALLFGGKTASSEVLNDSWFYRTRTRQWTHVNFKGKTPPARCHHAAAYSATARSFFISGGLGTDGEALQGTYQLADGKWKELTVKEEAPARTHHSLSVVSTEGSKEHLLAFGGFLWGSESNDLWSLSLESKTKRWLHITDAAGSPPPPRRGHSAIASGSRCFIYGGTRRHWLAWEVSFFDINLFDFDVTSWFEVLLMSPLATPQSYGFAVAAGNPNTSIHIFAAGSGRESDGAAFSVGAVCSTLDICMFAQGIRDTRVVCGDSRKQVEGLRHAVRSAKEDSGNQEERLHALATTADSLALKFEALLQRVVEAHEEAATTLQSVQAFSTKVKETASTVATKEAAAQRKIDEMEAKMNELNRKLKKLERLMTMEKEEAESA